MVFFLEAKSVNKSSVHCRGEEFGFQLMQILDLLGMYFDAAVVFVTSHSLLFRLAMAILCIAYLPAYLDSLNVEKVSL